MCDISGLVHSLVHATERNALLREQNTLLSCMLLVTSIGWGIERYRRLQKKTEKGE